MNQKKKTEYGLKPSGRLSSQGSVKSKSKGRKSSNNKVETAETARKYLKTVDKILANVRSSSQPKIIIDDLTVKKRKPTLSPHKRPKMKKRSPA